MEKFELVQGMTDCSPKDVDYDASRLDVLKKHFIRLMDEKKIHAATYCIARHGQIFAHGAIGLASRKENETKLVQPDTVFGIASETKTFTAVAIFKLVEDGLIRLDDPVCYYLPQFKEKPFDTITIYQLLTHTSGLYPDENCFPNKYHKDAWDLIYSESERLNKSNDFDWLSVALGSGLKERPGTQWMYCSFGFVVLGAVISAVTGKFVHSYIEDEIIKPLGMTDSGFCMTKKMAERAFIYDTRQEEWLKRVAAGECSGTEDEGTIWEKVPQTGGGLSSTAKDMVRYGNMLLGKGRLGDVRILGRKAFEKMTTSSLHNIPDFCWGANTLDRKYGIGFDMRDGEPYTWSKGTFYHEGAGACSLIMDPVEDITAAYFVPFVGDGWYSDGLYNTHNIIWSGIL